MKTEPIHVHVEKAGAEAKIWMDPISEKYSYGFKARERKEIINLVRMHRIEIINSWNEQSKNRVLDERADNRSEDPFDRLILEKGIRIRQFMISQELDVLVLLLTNSSVIKVALKHFPKLKNATKKDLEAAEIKGDGIGMRWRSIDEDISLKGLVKEAAMNDALDRLRSAGSRELSLL